MPPDELDNTATAATADRISLQQLKQGQEELANKNDALETRVTALENIVNDLVTLSPADLARRLKPPRSSSPAAPSH
jgi:hypothetical protein